MRDSEVKHLERGSVSIWRDDQGVIVRRRVTSQAFKGEDEPTGVTATWVVSAPVERAISVLERLQPPSQPNLFAVLPTSRYYQQASKEASKTSNQTAYDLQHFVGWINTYCAVRGRADNIPLVNGRQWELSSRQFRRTLAWFIARQPGGAIAGALQYRHLRVQMFEGYPGTSESGFRDEVESEEAIARGEKLGDLILDHDYYRLTGPAAEQAEARLAEFERKVQFNGKVINDPKRLKRYMERHDPHIYPGRFVTCVHQADRALCRRSDGQEGPSLPDCRPLRCRNVALSRDNITAFQESLERYDQRLERGDQLAPLVRHRMAHKRQEIADF